MGVLYNRQKGICPVWEKSLGYFNNGNLEVHNIKQRSLFVDVKEAEKI